MSALTVGNLTMPYLKLPFCLCQWELCFLLSWKNRTFCSWAVGSLRIPFIVLMSLSLMSRQNFTCRKCLVNKYVLNLLINKKRQEVERISIKPQANCFIIIIIYNATNFSLIINRRRKLISRVKSENGVWQIG